MINYNKLWLLIEKKNITTYYLRYKCGQNNISYTSLKRLENNQYVSMSTIDYLCNILDCDISDIVEHVKG